MLNLLIDESWQSKSKRTKPGDPPFTNLRLTKENGNYAELG